MAVRSYYLNQLLTFKDKPFIKVLTGMRRVGKSTLLEQYHAELLRQGIAQENILFINFELPDFFSIFHYQELTNMVLDWSKQTRGKKYLLLDEVGRVGEWEKAVNGFHALKDFDITITGSNADLLSSDLSSYIAGRFIEILIHPFSYAEFKEEYPTSTLTDYITLGGMPLIIPFQLQYETSMTALRDSFRSAVLQDVISRYQPRSPIVLERLLHYIYANVATTFSASSIQRALSQEFRSVSVDTVLSYLSYLESAFLIYKVQRYDIHGKQRLKTEEKYYIADHGIREAIAGKNSANIGRILENIVFLELKRRGYTVFVGKINAYEIDFIASKDNNKVYLQVSYQLVDEATAMRERRPYNEVNDSYPKYILTLDTLNLSDEGVLHLNLEQFLLNPRLIP